MLEYFMNSVSTLRPFDTLHGHWVYIVVIWYTIPRVGILYLEKSGNTGSE
jgi:hypothetical protein